MTPSKPVKPKKCRHCKALFIPTRPPGQVACSFECAMAISRAKGAKASAVVLKGQRKALSEGRVKLKSLSDWRRIAQAAFNTFIRHRDSHLPCISCGSGTATSWDAGHYRSRGACPEMAYDEKNCYRQCVQCNQHLHGNAIEMRLGIVARMGQEVIEYLERSHPPKKYTVTELQAMIAYYKAKLKALADYNL